MEEAIPILRVSDAAASVAWYGRLGYRQEWEHRFDDGLPTFVSIAREGAARLFLSEHAGDARPDTLVYLRVADVDTVAAAVGAPVDREPWGRQAEVTDPDGNRIRIGEAAGDRPASSG